MEEETQEEYVILDKAGRVQIPREMLVQMGIGDNKVKMDLVDGKIVIAKPDLEKVK